MKHIVRSCIRQQPFWLSFLQEDKSLTSTEEILLVKKLASSSLAEIVQNFGEDRLDPMLFFLRIDSLTIDGTRFLYRKVISETYKADFSLSMVEEAICKDIQSFGENDVFSEFSMLELIDVQRWLDWIICENEEVFVRANQENSQICGYICAARANLKRLLVRKGIEC